MGHGLWVHCDNRECLHRARTDLEATFAITAASSFVGRSECGLIAEGYGPRDESALWAAGFGKLETGTGGGVYEIYTRRRNDGGEPFQRRGDGFGAFISSYCAAIDVIR